LLAVFTCVFYFISIPINLNSVNLYDIAFKIMINSSLNNFSLLLYIIMVNIRLYIYTYIVYMNMYIFTHTHTYMYTKCFITNVPYLNIFPYLCLYIPLHSLTIQLIYPIKQKKEIFISPNLYLMYKPFKCQINELVNL